MVSRATLAVIAIVAVCATFIPVEAQFVRTAGATLRLCYFNFGGIGDLGYTFSFNLGRLRAQAKLQQEYPDIKIESLYSSEVFFGISNKTENTLQWIYRGCHVMITSEATLLGLPHGVDGNDWFPNAYPNISWIVRDPVRTDDVTLPNRVFAYHDFTGGYYATGIAAAHQSKTCIGLISAWEDIRNPNDAINGFIHGVRSVNTTLKIEQINMNNWYWPPAERQAAKLLREYKGCDIIAHYTDPREIDTYAGDITTPDVPVMSIGAHADLQLYVGDSALAAIYVDWTTVLLPLIRDVINSGRVTHNDVPFLHGIKQNGVTTTSLSPEASFAAIQAFEAALPTIDDEKLFCGTIPLRNGHTIIANSSDGCMKIAQKRAEMTAFLKDDHVHYHPGPFNFSDSCPAGTTWSYTGNATGADIKLVCTECPAMTFSDTAGSASCTPCPDGTESLAGAPNCTIKASAASTSLSTGALAGIIVAATVVVGGALVAVIAVRTAAARKNKNAPKQAPLALIFTDVESSTKLWQDNPKAMGAAMEIHHEVIRKVIAENGAYEVKTVGDAFMIACHTISDGVVVAMGIQSALHAATWPETFSVDNQNKNNYTDAAPINGLKVRVGVHWCRDVTVKYESFHQYYDYYGNDVNLAARIEGQGRGGQVLIEADALEVLRNETDFLNDIGPHSHIQLYAKNITLKGVDDPKSVFTILPKELAGRQFAPIEGHENDQLLQQNQEESCSEAETCSQSSMSSQGVYGHASMIRKLCELLSVADQKIVISKFAAAVGAPNATTGTLNRRIRSIVEHWEKNHGPKNLAIPVTTTRRPSMGECPPNGTTSGIAAEDPHTPNPE